MDHNLVTLVAITGGLLVAALGLAALFRPSRAQRLPYALRPSLLTTTERAFYHVLAQAVGNRWVICPQVRLADVIEVRRGTAERQGHFNRIKAKHLDFVIADARTLAPLSGIELDDRSHRRADRRERDAFLDKACADVGLPLLRIPVGRAYDVTELAARLQQAIGQRNAA